MPVQSFAALIQTSVIRRNGEKKVSSFLRVRRPTIQGGPLDALDESHSSRFRVGQLPLPDAGC